MRFLAPLILLIVFSSTIHAQYERPGSSSAQFLKIDVSPRAAALAGSYISLVEGAESVYYNSGALARTSTNDASISHTSWFAGINHNFFSIVRNVSPQVGTFALSVTALYTDEMAVRTPLQPEGTGETFVAANYRFGLSYSRTMSKYVSFGGTINYIDMKLYDGFSASAFGFDLGVLYKSEFRDFTFGMQISNFGSDVNFYNEAYPLPTYFSFGGHVLAIDSESIDVIVTGTASKPNDGSPQAGLGSEVILLDNIALRIGQKLNHNVQNLSAGVGYNFNLNNLKLRVDYSWSDYAELGSAQRLGVSVSF